MKRGEFIKLSAGLAAFLGVSENTSAAQIDEILSQDVKASGSMKGFSAPKIDKVRVAIIGMGNRGTGLIEMFDYLIQKEYAEITALCDVDEKKCLKGAEYLAGVQSKRPSLYTKDANNWQKLMDSKSIDLAIICAPWDLHATMCIYGMNAGVHVATEVPGAVTMDEMHRMIFTSENTQKHCMMMENCCFNDEELFVLNMVNEGVFGDLTHGECAYLHDLRKHLLDETYYADNWRLKAHTERNGNLYPTHGLGPMSMYMDITRGDNFDYLVSMSSKEASLSKSLAKSDFSNLKIVTGDVNTTMIKTKVGKSILVQFDVHTGRPYSRINQLCGTKAVHEGYPSRLYIDGDEPTWGGHRYLNDEDYTVYREKYTHPVWKKLRAEATKKSMGHGGMDFVMIYRLIRCLNEGMPLDIDVYESMAWSSIAPLSGLSVAKGSGSVAIPDFTGGNWETYMKHPIYKEV